MEQLTGKGFQDEIEKRVRRHLSPLFQRYRMNIDPLEATLKWKPIVLVIGNYSSGKSTLINEILGLEVQRTGQAPTDDSFTVITAPTADEAEGEVPGANLVNDARLPFASFRSYGEQFMAHFRMKKLNVPVLQDVAIIDTPGMLDSVTEKDRGYDYMAVLGDLARLSDLIVLMFDPHKAGTIKETYTVIRNTLPESSGEDRILFVLSRIDECDNQADLVRSYGTLCWNLSQMTGRKDIPRIFLTFSPQIARHVEGLNVWMEERNELIKRIKEAPALKLSHMLQNVDKQLHDLRMVVEAMSSFGREGRTLLAEVARLGMVIGLIGFFSLDILFQRFLGFPSRIFLASLLSGAVTTTDILIPAGGFLASLLLMVLWLLKWRLPRFIKGQQSGVERLVSLETEYQRHTWSRVKDHVIGLLGQAGLRDFLPSHRINLNKIDKFLREDLHGFYVRLQ